VDYELNEDQQAIVDAIEQLLGQHAGAARAIELNKKGDYDRELDAALAESGFLELALGDDTGPLEAALLVEAVARAAGVVTVGAAALVAPQLAGRLLPGPVAVAAAGGGEIVRFAGAARTLLVDGGEEARIVELGPADSEPVRSNFGYPMARLASGVVEQGESLGPGSGARLRDWWRVAIAVETAGTMKAALDYTVAYLKQRRQFGRAIGSFQAVQHRLAECAIVSEGSRWLAYEAAWLGAPPEAAATAAAYAASAATQVFAETHQLSGAIGFTHDHDLHVWSMRLQALKLEMSGVTGHRRAIAQARWGGSGKR
jgi:alkylation response protein AidB-like acyl-CoA dehydrogenase